MKRASGRLRVASALVAPIALFAAACGSSSSSGSGGGLLGGGGSTPAATSSNDGSSSGGSSSGGSTGGTSSQHLPSQATLQNALLTSSDVPGFSVDPSANDDSSSSGGPTNAGCAIFAGKNANDDNHAVEAKEGFTKGSGLTMQNLTFQIDGYAPQHSAQSQMQQVRSALASCPTTSWTDSGMTVQMHLSTATAPKLGDDALAVRIQMQVNGSGQAIPMGGGLVAVRKGNVIVISTYLAAGSAGSMPDSTLVQKAYTKYTQTVGQ